jgi:1,4-dihydroxy-2-naphthoyl-CoA hydrolase
MPDYDDAWHDDWYRRMEEGGGNIIAAMRMRMVSAASDCVVMSMPIGPAVRQGTGVFAAGALMQLADVAATSLYLEALRADGVENAPFPLSIQISVNLLRNTNEGGVISESRFIHRGRSMVVVESKVHDEAGRLLCTVTSTHVPSPDRAGS